MDEQTPKRRRGCLFYGCFTFSILFLVVLLGSLLAYRYAKKMFNEFTDTKPMPLPAVTLSSAQIAEVQHRVDAFRSEHLRPVNMNHVGLNGEKSYYELYGEKQVAAGHYRNVIRYRDHFLPLAEALARQADNGI